MPADKINRALGTDLEEGVVWISSGAHRHIAKDHPTDYPFIIAAITDIVTSPLYIGQDPKHTENFYVVKPLPANSPKPHGLISIGLEQDDEGNYRVKSAYAISQETVTNRRASKRLHVAI